MTVLANSERLSTVVAIAAHFDVSRQTIYTWRKEGMPDTDDVAVMESWIAEHHPPEDEEESLARQIAKAKLAKLLEEGKGKSLDNRVREGELVNRDAIERWLCAFVSEARQIIESWTPAAIAEIPGESRLVVNDILNEQVRILLMRLSEMPVEMWTDETVKDAE